MKIISMSKARNSIVIAYQRTWNRLTACSADGNPPVNGTAVRGDRAIRTSHDTPYINTTRQQAGHAMLTPGHPAALLSTPRASSVCCHEAGNLPGFPNHMLEQFSREFLQLYPQAKVLVTQREDLQAGRRRQFVARCATGDWDAVIMSRSAFERIPMSPDAQREYLSAEAARMKDFIAASRESDGMSVKRLQGALLRAEERTSPTPRSTGRCARLTWT